ncbi:uncharacterized protein B0H18DRAFT_1045733, partial [Fomitopsis serialis]|uniref:uncharacterized protein n=1 Tax=Fomitopsis serialis TaxID=139415 RepID=UPI002008BF74
MSPVSVFLSAVYVFAAFWIILHLAFCLLLPRTPRVALSYYPPPSDRSPVLLTEGVLLLNVRTTQLNWFAKSRRENVRRGVTAAYTIGGVLAAAGMVGALGVLFWTVVRLAVVLLGRWAGASAGAGIAANTPRLWKRDEVASPVAAPATDYDIPIYAIVSVIP